MKRASLLAGAGGIVIGAGAMLAFAGVNRSQTEMVVRDYLLANPEIVRDAQLKLQERQTAELIEANRALFETPFGSAWAGARDGDVVLVEFFDYSCGYCRQSNADIERLLREDPKLKVVYRDWPVLGADSIAAAETSLAAAEQGRFRAFYDRLFAHGRPTEAARAAAAKMAGVRHIANPRYREEIAKNDELARLVGASGTPAFVVGDQVLRGYSGYAALKDAIAKARSEG